MKTNLTNNFMKIILIINFKKRILIINFLKMSLIINFKIKKNHKEIKIYKIQFKILIRMMLTY